MSSVIKSLAVVVSLFATSTFANTTLPMVSEKGIPGCGIELTKGTSFNQRWVVRDCLFSKNGKNFIEHTIRSKNKIEDLTVVVPVSNSRFMHLSAAESDLVIDMFMFYDKKLSYSVAKGEHQFTGDQYGSHSEYNGGVDSDFDVDFDNSTVTMMDPKTMNIRIDNFDGKYGLNDFGISVKINKRVQEPNTVVLAPER